MASVNKIILVGHLGKNPEEKTVGGNKLVTFSMAMTEAWTNKQSGERQEKTEWANVSVWNEALAEVAMKYLTKGSKVYIEGQMETHSYEKGGQKHYQTQVVLRPFKSDLVLLGDAPDRPDQPRQRRAPGEEPAGRR